ncbi:MAG: sigma-70 family RNA polymerase sigma factor [Bryobacteraceae bacterium]
MHNYSNFWRDRAEGELVRSAQGGSSDAFEELWRRSRPRLWRAASSVLNSPEEAEDALQNACWKAYQHLSSFRADSSFNTWLTSIVVNQARMRLRQLRRARLISLDHAPEDRPTLMPDFADTSPDPEVSYAGVELVSALHREIRRLPAQFRQVLLLHLQNMPVTDVAEHLGLTVTAAKARLFRARHYLDARMRRYDPVSRPVAA